MATRLSISVDSRFSKRKGENLEKIVGQGCLKESASELWEESSTLPDKPTNFRDRHGSPFEE